MSAIIFRQPFVKVNEETLEECNRTYLHCNDPAIWKRVSSAVLESLLGLTSSFKDVEEIQSRHIAQLKAALEETFLDPNFTDQILSAFQTHIGLPFEDDPALVKALGIWVFENILYLSKGEHLMRAFEEDMEGASGFSEKILHLSERGYRKHPDGASERVSISMRNFLRNVREANERFMHDFPKEVNAETAVVLSVKNGPGGHIGPHKAMAARLEERNFKVITIHYDTDLDAGNDPFKVLGLTFENGEPMTEEQLKTQWVEKGKNLEVVKIINCYVASMKSMYPQLFRARSGVHLLTSLKKINPALIVTTMAYHWTWRSAYRLPAAKTFLVASDVFFHYFGLQVWYRQPELARKHQQIHFGVMTSDLQLLRDYGRVHDEFWIGKYPDGEHDLFVPKFNGFVLDNQVSVVGAPINPTIKAITEEEELARLRQKWNIPEGSVSVCISRGKIGESQELEEAIESYRTQEHFPKPVVLLVVCALNESFFNRINAGEFNNLGPNVTVRALPLLTPGDFGEVRSISTADDIKAGGGSTFEGWYLISKGVKSVLFLTAGATAVAELWWEKVNCAAMQKWGVGQVFVPKQSKVSILTSVIENGPRTITNKFPRWEEPFDNAVRTILNR